MKAQNTPERDSAEAKEAMSYGELLALAHEDGLKAIETQLLITPNEENGRLAIVKVTVETSHGRFEGLGDADPGNVAPAQQPHLIRVAETRAKERALRDAVDCGIDSREEQDGTAHGWDPPVPGLGVSRRPESPRHAPPPSPPRRESSEPQPMSEPQRRYLFRLLAAQGYRRQAAEERLKDLLQVGRLAEATKHQASALIEQLVQDTQGSAPARGTDGNGAARETQGF